MTRSRNNTPVLKGIQKKQKLNNDVVDSEDEFVLDDNFIEPDTEPDTPESTTSEYFVPDILSLQRSLVTEMSKKFYLPKKDLDNIISNTLNKYKDRLTEYTGLKPADSNWKIGTESSVVFRLEPELKSLREELEAENPTMVKILNANIPKEEKKRAIELFDILNNCPPYTEHHLAVKNQIKEVLKRSSPSQKVLKLNETISKELNALIDKPTDYRERIFKLSASNDIKARIYEKYLQFSKLSPDAKDYDSLKTWLEHALSLPYEKQAPKIAMKTPEEINDFCSKVKSKLDEKVYGLEHVKQELLQILVNRHTNPEGTNIIPALVGAPGVGKSLIFSTLAETMNIPFERISLGGLTDANVLKGHSSTYMGSEPGIIVQILKRIKCNNGIVFIDELDKLGETDRGREVQYALLHITDATTNKDFRDTYLSDIPIDLSKIWFVIAMNNENWLDKAMKDRLHLIHIKPYSKDEKIDIVQKYLLPEALKSVGMEPKSVTISKEVIVRIINRTGDGNVRPLKEQIKLIVSRINLQRSVTLKDGSTGAIVLDYKIPNLQFPLYITENNYRHIYKDSKEEDDIMKKMMYM